MSEQTQKPGMLIKILVGGLPLGLFVGVVVAALLYVRNHEEALPELNASGKGYTRDMTAASIADRYQKFEDGSDGRGVGSPEGLVQLKAAEALLQTSLNMSNMGFRSINSLEGENDGTVLNALWVDVLGQRNPSEVIEVRVPYDQAEDDNGSGSLALAVALELANSLTGTENRRTIRFAFVPDGAVDGPVSAAYQAIYDNRQVRLLAGFDLFDSGDFDPARYRTAEGKIEWQGVFDLALKTRKEIVAVANQ